MEVNKGKPVTTSVPSFAVRFHANAEEVEEIYGNDDENAAVSNEPAPESSSPLKSYLPKLIKRSASIDTTHAQDSSPPSDPWRFLSDIKGKITKSVEEKLTEIKARKEEESTSPRKLQVVRDETSSISDSEDLSESSISKTCGIISTTEGVEMSSDEDTTSIDKDAARRKEKKKSVASPSGLRRRFKLFRNKSPQKEGHIASSGLREICSIASGLERPVLPSDEIESGVDVLEENDFGEGQDTIPPDVETFVDETEVLQEISEHIENMEVDGEQVLNVNELSGTEAKEKFARENESVTVFAPVGFVDMRDYTERTPTDYRYLLVLAVFAVFYYIIQLYSIYMAGVLAGVTVTFAVTFVYNKIFSINGVVTIHGEHPKARLLQNQRQILEIPAVKEYQPVGKFEGWMNEYPDVYDPLGYHISQTQSVFVRLQGHLLRLSHTKTKVPKRAMWNEPKIKAHLTYHRIYNILGAKVSLLPVGLTRKRFWSKKYPICITLAKDQLNFDYYSTETKSPANESKCKSKKEGSVEKKKGSLSLAPQRFSKLTEDDYDLDSESRGSSPSPSSSPDKNEDGVINGNGLDAALKDALENDEQGDEDLYSLPDDGWSPNVIEEDSPSETRLYLFARCGRDKEDWFRRFARAAHKGSAAIQSKDGNDSDVEVQESSMSETLLRDYALEMEYTKYMSKYTQVDLRKSIVHVYPKLHKWRRRREDSAAEKEKDTHALTDFEKSSNPALDMLWVNAMMGRIMFDCVHSESFTARIKDRIQRKLSSIKLPYFIEELNLTELSLGSTAPVLHHATEPVVDIRGLWIDIDVTYEGLITLILQTNLNLMKLKQQRNDARLTEARPHAMYHSDLDDSAESSSNDESPSLLPNMPGVSFDSTAGGPSNTSKKVLKMVDKIAESKLFQAATDNRYIKNLMEGVSNTDLRLKVEMRSLSGVLVLNVPPPPSDRVFVGFRPVPKLLLSAQPIVGERNITMLRVIHWIEKKLVLEFQKVMVVPNMEDFVVPVMCQNLPG